jgi:predicted metal-dependent enzyme (double-stranded beta helix superfamily)
MAMQQKMPGKLITICKRWSKDLIQLSGEKDRMHYVQNELPVLLQSRDIFIELLGNIVGGNPYPDTRQAQLFEDEILLYLNTKPMFSIRMFIYEPGIYTPIHDHNSWGVIGAALGKIGVIKYVREDDGSKPGYARLRKTEYLFLEGSQTDLALPLNQGIHQTGNADSQTSIMISVYGRPIRQMYIHQFDFENRTIVRLYPPRIKKRMLAARALDIINKQPAQASSAKK